jgi:hypothetical protein
MKRMFWAILCAVILLLGWFFATNSRAATETAPYQVVETNGRFELRDYEALHLAEADMNPDAGRSSSMNGGFRQLFRYITGENETGEKIAMTTPVLVRNEGRATSMSFVMPKAGVERGLPAPKLGVKLQTLPAMRVAVVRFSGISNGQMEKDQVATLRAWAEKRGLKLLRNPLLAYYDPPWTPGFLRRNEVLWPVQVTNTQITPQ